MKREHERGRKYLTAAVLVMLGLGIGVGNGTQQVYADSETEVLAEASVPSEFSESGDSEAFASETADAESIPESAETTDTEATADTDAETNSAEEVSREETKEDTETEEETTSSSETSSELTGEASENENTSEEAGDQEEESDPEEDSEEEEEAPVYLSIIDGVDYSPVYNYFYYKNRYSDLAATFGDDQAAMLQHFLSFGMSEERQASESFSEVSYRLTYQDLRLAFGKDYAKYYYHYLNSGMQENRVATGVTTLQNPVTVQDGVDYAPVYDYSFYTKHNTDVAKAFGQDDIGVLNHFVTFGMDEQRQAISTFNERSYRYTYPDLRLAFGSDYAKYYLHYINSGSKENRITTGTKSFTPITSLNGTDYSAVYDFNYYISRYADIKKAYSDDDAGAIKYFVSAGMKNQHQAIAAFDEKSYRYRYQDLRIAFRTDYEKYYQHYMQFGQKENRNAAGGLTTFVNPLTTLNGTDYSPVYDFSYYVTNNSSAASYKDDDVGALIYFVNTGMNLRHQAAENFEVMSYRRAYTDLRSAFGDNYPKYYLHYILYGKKEGRTQTTGWVSNGLIVCIDPGHQRYAMTSKEPIGPGSSTTKMKVTGGATGVATRNTEYQINLDIALKLRDELEDRGYTVVMTRTTNNVSLSNIDRSKIATNANADIFIRLHCDSVDSSSVTGVHCLGPATNNPYLSSDIIKKSNILCDCLQAGQVAQTGQKTRTNSKVNNMTGINWATMPVSIVEMGFLSNPSEDRFLSKSSNQYKIAKGLANGVDNYFAKIA